ncbi:MAG: M28 family peptidase [Candidatus Lokiarchaeota archaeon]|nr:M28 family peptidase [Candidatus Lokiarchaeota archaeon]
MNTENSKQKQSFNDERLFNYVKKFSFPRLAGTNGEQKAVDLTKKTFKNIGYEELKIQKEQFEFSDFYSTTLIKLMMVINLTFSLFVLMFTYINLYFTIFIGGIMAFVVFLIIKGLKHPEDPGFWGEYYGKTISATNVFVKLPAKKLSAEHAGDIIISAHLDSKSQTFKTYWRVFFYRVWLYGGIFLGIFFILLFIRTYTIIKINLLIVGSGIWTFTIIISISNIFLMFLNTHNNSPGALDNASGMAVVFELSDYFKEKALDNFNIWFCQFSAEELGTMGSRVFVNNHEGEFIKGRVFQINVDIISCICESKNQVEYLKSYGVLPRKKIAPLLSKYLDSAAKKENISIKGFHLSTGAHTDSVPFHLRGFDSVDIVTRAGGKYTHNKVDTPDKVDPEILMEACLIIKRVILSLDGDYDILCKSKELICDLD